MSYEEYTVTLQGLKLNRKYVPLSLADFQKQYAENEERNDHALNVLLSAYFAGSSVDLYIGRRLYLQQQKAGYLTTAIRLERDQLVRKLSPALMAKGASREAAKAPAISRQDRERLIDHRIAVEGRIAAAGLSIYQFDRCLSELAETVAPEYNRRLYFWALFRAWFEDFVTVARFCDFVQGQAETIDTIPTRTALFYALAVGRDFERKING